MKPLHCIGCGARLVPAEMGKRVRDRCPVCGAVAWRNPAPVAMALIRHQGRLVLIRRAAPPLAGYWAPPAGYVECGESVPEAAVRESREECGLDIVIDGLVGVYSRADVDVLIVAYAARSVGGELRAGDDAEDVMAVASCAIPEQIPPASEIPLECWFHEVIRSTTADWR